MKSIALIIPWYGSFHNYFKLWMRSAEFNQTVDFYIVTDNQAPDKCPKNIKFIHMTFDEVRARLQKHVPFKIKLTPYKLCDFRPLFGLAFEDIFNNYDYWGYCDIDLIFGDIRKFLTDEVLTDDRILQRGHFSLYRNDEKMKKLYLLTDNTDNMAYSYKKAWRTNFSCYFDEFLGINIVTDQYCKAFNDHRVEKVVLDPPAYILPFQSAVNSDVYYGIWENGHLYRQRYDTQSKKSVGAREEFMYLHMQKRKMQLEITCEGIEKFYIIPNKFTNCPNFNISEQDAAEYTKKHFANDKKKNIKKLLKFGPIDCIQHRLRRRKIDTWLAKNKPNF